MHTKKFEKLTRQLTLEAASFNAASWDHGIAGTAMLLFNMEKRVSFTWDDLAVKFGEIMHIPEDVARAIELPDVPNDILKYVPAAFAVEQLGRVLKGATATEIQDGWRKICNVY